MGKTETKPFDYEGLRLLQALHELESSPALSGPDRQTLATLFADVCQRYSIDQFTAALMLDVRREE